jgi:CBS domain-containing protein
MERIDRNECGIALVVDERRRLIGTITDGDIRRAILGGTDLAAPVSLLVESKQSDGRAAISAPVGTSPTVLFEIMTQKGVHQIPLLTAEGEVADLVLLNDLAKTEAPSLQAVIMAGGFGKRLRPLTDDVPKPMLLVGSRPVM